MAAAASRPFRRFSAEALGASPVLARGIAASTEQRADVDVAALRALHPGPKTLAAWLDGGGAALLAARAAVKGSAARAQRSKEGAGFLL